jgi:hypothetical protein
MFPTKLTLAALGLTLVFAGSLPAAAEEPPTPETLEEGRMADGSDLVDYRALAVLDTAKTSCKITRDAGSEACVAFQEMTGMFWDTQATMYDLMMESQVSLRQADLAQAQTTRNTAQAETEIQIVEAENRLAAARAAGRQAEWEAYNLLMATEATGRQADIEADALAALTIAKGENAVEAELGQIEEEVRVTELEYELNDLLEQLTATRAELGELERAHEQLQAEAAESCNRNEAAGSAIRVCDEPGHVAAREAELARKVARIDREIDALETLLQ